MEIIILTPKQIQSYFDDLIQKMELVLQDSSKTQAASKEWLTSKEVCDLLKISYTTLHDWSKKGLLKKHKLGNRIRFRHDEILESLQRIETKNQIR
ncbi:MAG TPA: helix-turn-helix domain-containing protein [Saprospiraceae bacterium]|nr:helix-turn-helix domain-containing protein [Saprospiraceae bacterium]